MEDTVPDCREIISSEDYADFIIPYAVTGENYLDLDVACRQIASSQYEIVHVNLESLGQLNLYRFSYYSIPKLYGLLDIGAMEASNITRVQEQPSLSLKGNNVIVGIIDTGIDYTHPAFQNIDGTSRIIRIWDQQGMQGDLPENFQYGTEYKKEQIDEALRQENPFTIIPQLDTNGHGTSVAGIAAGSESILDGFTGAAPQADIAVVKLKEAKTYLKNFYFVPEDVVAYQENDIIMAVRYLISVAYERRQPLAICLGVGSNQGSHSGLTPLSQALTEYGNLPQNVIVAASGNETGRGHHYFGVIEKEIGYEDVEIRVGEKEEGFSLELWAQAPEVYNIGIRSPSGEEIPQISARLGGSQELNFILNRTRIFVDYRLVEQRSGGFLILMRFSNLTPGIWTIRVYNTLFINGEYHMWLPLTGFITSDTKFLRANPYTTLTTPSTATGVMTVGAYEYNTDSIFLNSGRGNTRLGRIKPDITAPGVNILVPRSSGGYTTKSGTSISAGMMAGASALLLEWAVVEGNYPTMNTGEATTYFIRGADRKDTLAYPNRQWGYGTLNMYQVFERIL